MQIHTFASNSACFTRGLFCDDKAKINLMGHSLTHLLPLRAV
jgi:hypothetical protein